jgi:hypothetical protein
MLSTVSLWRVDAETAAEAEALSAEFALKFTCEEVVGVIIALFKQTAALREYIVNELLERCYRASALSFNGNSVLTNSRASASGNGSNALEDLLPEMGAAFSTRTSVHRGGQETSKSQIAEEEMWVSQARICGRILAEVVEADPSVGTAVFTSFLSRLQSSDGFIRLPPPSVLHYMLACIVRGTAQSYQTESTLLIILQKLLSSVCVSSDSNILFASKGNSHSGSASGRGRGQRYSVDDRAAPNGRGFGSGGDITSADLMCSYTQVSLGLMLAVHLLRREAPPLAGESQSDSQSVSHTIAILISLSLCIYINKRARSRRGDEVVRPTSGGLLLEMLQPAGARPGAAGRFPLRLSSAAPSLPRYRTSARTAVHVHVHVQFLLFAKQNCQVLSI